ncbi:pyruvate phosphate dikinase-like enzyme [Kribbella sp. VKM Ac-2571]|uniref:PEP/pyruvate-binding domain-containing protein n=1 Tax=Kribbella sp. VKM Ac-2571 TaxID=2512222 RepID=UPI00105D6561|nr:PEP/pyruvate-binding domain-containing protein [Kribbella sp. VKM Ac-2571]TDO48361.1 pyruvate phosphate dikinase-like enzyme [Kribbella sp. VKM Ac-2571]
MNSEYVVRLDGEPMQSAVGAGPEQIGVKAARLAELAREGIRVPEGFAVTATAYREFVHQAGLAPTIAQEIRRFRAGRDLGVAAAEIRSAFRDASMPATVVDEILDAYQELGGDGTEVAVRCSPVTFADAVRDDVFLHLTTGADVVAACRRCFASLYNTVAVGNREAEGIDHLKVAMPVTVQRMVRADLGGSGTARGENTFVRVRASWGLGEPPAADADLYSVHPGARPLIVRHRGAKLTKTVYADPRGTRPVPTTPAERTTLVLTDDELQELARWSVVADKHFRRPTTLDWAKDGQSGELYVIEVRPGVAPAVTIVARGRSVLETSASQYR